MADYTITVSFSGGAVSADPPNLKVAHKPGVPQTIQWVRADETFNLKQVIFLRPIGTGRPLGVPTPGPDGTIVVTDDNSNPFPQSDRFKYLVLIEKGGTVIPSPDPEIVNEPGGGADDDDDGGGPKGGG